MEAGDGAAGYGDEHERPDGQPRRVQVSQRELRDGIAPGDDAAEDARRHEDQHRAEQGIKSADDLVDGQKRGEDVIDEDHDDPECAVQRVRRQARQERGGGGDEHRAGQDKEQDGENAHAPLCALAQIDAAELSDGSAVVPLGDHAGHIIVDAAAQHGAEDDPEEHHRAEAGAHQRAEDRAGARDVQKLHQKRLPGGHGEKIHPVLLRISRRLPVIRRKHLFHHCAIDEITRDQHRKR